MKSRKKELVIYAVSAFIIAFPLQIIVDLLSGRGLNYQLWPYVWGGFVFSVLMTLFKYISDKRKSHK